VYAQTCPWQEGTAGSFCVNGFSCFPSLSSSFDMTA